MSIVAGTRSIRRRASRSRARGRGRRRRYRRSVSADAGETQLRCRAKRVFDVVTKLRRRRNGSDLVWTASLLSRRYMHNARRPNRATRKRHYRCRLTPDSIDIIASVPITNSRDTHKYYTRVRCRQPTAHRRAVNPQTEVRPQAVAVCRRVCSSEWVITINPNMSMNCNIHCVSKKTRH